MPVVAMPDGAQVSFPDTMPDAQIRSMILQKFPNAATQSAQPQTDSTLSDVAKSAAAGVGEGITGLAGLPADITNLAAKGVDYLAGTNTQSYTQPIADYAGGDAIKGYAEKYLTGEFHKPQTGAGEIAQTLGQFAPAVIGGPETLATKIGTRVVAPALASEAAGSATQGTPLEPYARAAGAVLGAATPVGLSRLISPATIAPERQAAVDLLQSKGVPLDAAMQSGNKAMGYLHSELGDSLGAGGKATASNDNALKGFTTAALNEGGVVGEGGTAAADFKPPNVNANLTDMKNGFNAIADKYTASNPIKVDPGLKAQADEIMSHFEANTGNQPKIIEGYLKRLGFDMQQTPELPAGISEKSRQQILSQLAAKEAPVAITGSQYQSISSDIAKAMRSGTSPDLKFALSKFKGALDDAVQDGLAQEDQGTWQQLRSRWLNHLILEDAVKSSTDNAANGLITPAKLETSIQKFTKTGYSRGTSPLEPLARAGNQVLKQLPQSGTAPRAAARSLPALAGAAIGGHFGLIPGLVAGIAGPAALGRAVYSKPVQAYLKNQKGVSLRQIPLTRNLLSSGILSLPGAENPRQNLGR